MSRGTLRPVILAGLLMAAAVYPLVFTQPFPQDLAIKVFLFGGLAAAWNILGGFTGQVSLGNAIFFGIGAYSAGLVQTRLGTVPWVGIPLGMGAAVLVGLIIGFPCFRLKGHYFAMATLAIGEVVQTVFINWKWAGGAIGLYIPIRDDTWTHFQFGTTKLPYYYAALVFVLSVLLLSAWLMRSRTGYRFRAIK
ncbi:MAG TPA: branched-chain amino acid ABC transporter permease, partial [Candidatus Deferrimicrobiaceae bacterium]|nr:branched-chain amino acid ABC transporter permease [Candidatus Deferrimicrobiaceae bacterium]